MKAFAGLLLMLGLTTLMTAENINREIFPGEVHGWALAAEEQVYTPEDLYKYIDGASELYISFGFKKLYSRRFARSGWPEITVDLFDMAEPGNAFGVFAHGQEDPDQAVGQDSEYLDGLLRFWQGRWYASLLCSPETPEGRSALMELGRRLAARLGPPAPRPPEIGLLPRRDLDAASIRYFRDPAWQNSYRFIADGNVLGIGPRSAAVLAKYNRGRPRPVVLLVSYPDRSSAERALANFQRVFALPPGEGEAVRREDGEYCAAGLEGTVLAAVWHAAGAAPALELLRALRQEIAAPEGGGS
ncbi:MAG: hypothetical protein JXO51_11445 [Candidatus Aminicenantes bacterium]|nr:hypothetical protein [Candidatus Aminicenantes bacterium]